MSPIILRNIFLNGVEEKSKILYRRMTRNKYRTKEKKITILQITTVMLDSSKKN